MAKLPEPSPLGYALILFALVLCIAIGSWQLAELFGPNEDDQAEAKLTRSNAGVSRFPVVSIFTVYQGNISSVALHGEITDEMIGTVANLKKCRRVSFRDATFENVSSIQNLSRMPHLRAVMINRSRISDGEIAEGVKSLKQITFLYLEESEASSKTVDAILVAPNIKYLEIYGCKINDQLLRKLAALRPDIDIHQTGPAPY